MCFYNIFSTAGKGILSGHADGAIVRYFFDDEGTGLSQVGYQLSGTIHHGNLLWLWCSNSDSLVSRQVYDNKNSIGLKKNVFCSL